MSDPAETVRQGKTRFGTSGTVRAVTLIVGLIALVSCGGRSSRIPAVVVPPVSVHAVAAATSVGSIQVTASSVLLPNQFERVELHGARQQLHNELTRQLLTAGRFGENGELKLFLEITEFRLRPEWALRLAGAMGGPDLLGVKGRVVKNGVEVTSFETGVSTTIRLSFQYGDETWRVQHMAAELSRRIIAKL